LRFTALSGIIVLRLKILKMVSRNSGKGGRHNRNKLSRHRERTTVNQLLETFEVGDRVIIDIDSSTQDAMPHPRWQGKEGEVKVIRGDCYEVEIKDGGKKKTSVTSSAHLKRAKVN